MLCLPSLDYHSNLNSVIEPTDADDDNGDEDIKTWRIHARSLNALLSGNLRVAF